MTYERALVTKVPQHYFVSVLGYQQLLLGIRNGDLLRFCNQSEFDAFIQLLLHAWARAKAMGVKP